MIYVAGGKQELDQKVGAIVGWLGSRHLGTFTHRYETRPLEEYSRARSAENMLEREKQQAKRELNDKLCKWARQPDTQIITVQTTYNRKIAPLGDELKKRDYENRKEAKDKLLQQMNNTDDQVQKHILSILEKLQEEDGPNLRGEIMVIETAVICWRV